MGLRLPDVATRGVHCRRDAAGHSLKARKGFEHAVAIVRKTRTYDPAGEFFKCHQLTFNERVNFSAIGDLVSGVLHQQQRSEFMWAQHVRSRLATSKG